MRDVAVTEGDKVEAQPRFGAIPELEPEHGGEPVESNAGMPGGAAGVESVEPGQCGSHARQHAAGAAIERMA
jgi:hypothetical protein